MGKVIEFGKKEKPRLPQHHWRQEYLLFPYLYSLNLQELPSQEDIPGGAEFTLHPGNAARRLVNDQLLRVLALSPRDLRDAVFVTPPKIIRLKYAYSDATRNISCFTGFLNTVSAYVERLGAVVLDNLGMRCWYPEEWLGVVGEGPFELRNHLTLHAVPEEGSRSFWIHTHGMTQFACPDLEVRKISEEGKGPALQLLSRLIRYQVKNGPVFHEGCRVAIARGQCWVTFKHFRETTEESHYRNHYFRVLISVKK